MSGIRVPAVLLERRADGATLLRAAHPLPSYPARLTAHLERWAAAAPDHVFLAEREGAGWRSVTYAQALGRVRRIAQGLLDRGLSEDRPVLILSGNSVGHALLGLACCHAGVPYAPVSTAYSLLSADHAKLRQMVALARPGLVAVSDGAAFRHALDAAVPPGTEVAAAVNGRPGDTPLAELEAPETAAVAAAADRVGPDTLAKLLFTSGSTGAPKAVINTHRMLCANQAMIAAHFTFLDDEPPVLVDWLPWSHTFGGNNNFNLVLRNGGTLYLDAGRPVPGGFGPTLAALREVAPTLHMNVPKGWEMLAHHLRADPALNRQFFSRLRVLFYAAASLPAPLWDELARLSLAATGRVVPMVTGLGSTETAPMAFCNGPGARVPGQVGLPVAGIEVKLAPVEGKLEARVRGPSVTPGYWRDPARTREAFDAEGFLCMGDALAWVDPERPELGLRFDGRLAEDFKLLSGTWVSVGPLCARLLAAMAPHVRDVVVAGHGRDYLAVLALPHDPSAMHDPAVRAHLAGMLRTLAREAAGSSARVLRLAFLASPPRIDAGEVTDKGSINQGAVLRLRAAEVEALYAEPPPAHVLCADMEGVA